MYGRGFFARLYDAPMNPAPSASPQPSDQAQTLVVEVGPDSYLNLDIETPAGTVKAVLCFARARGRDRLKCGIIAPPTVRIRRGSQGGQNLLVRQSARRAAARRSGG